MFFCYFLIVSPWKIGGPSFEQTWIKCFVPRLVEVGPMVLEEKIFKIRQYIFRNFIIITAWKRAWPFIWTNLMALHPRMHCCKFGWNWCGFFWKFCKCIFAISDDGWQAIRKAHLSFQLRWAKNQNWNSFLIRCIKWSLYIEYLGTCIAFYHPDF